MASLSDRTYFPPLEECLKGEKLLLSWRTIASALADPEPSRLLSESVLAFLNDAFVASLFWDPARVFEAPTSQSKSEFETKTAAINVTPTPTGKFNLDAIKRDSLWLAKNAGVAEHVALRIVVIEFQARAESHLMSNLSAQDIPNIVHVSGLNGAQGTSALPVALSASLEDATAMWTTFEKEESRRRRLLSTYLSERRHFAMAADYMATLILASSRPQASSGGEEPRLPLGALQSEMPLTTAPAYLEYLSSRVGPVAAMIGPESIIQEPGYMNEDFFLDWMHTALAESFHALSILFQVLDGSCHTFATPSLVSRWFQFIAGFNFLEGIVPTESGLSELAIPLQTFACAISMVLLAQDRSSKFLDQELELGEDEKAYLQDSEVLLQVHRAIMAASETALAPSAPVVFAWTILLHRMHMGYQERVERRDLAQNQRAQAGFELESESRAISGPNTGRRNSAGSIISIEGRSYDVFLANAAMVQDVQIAEKLALGVTAGGLVYDVVATFASCAGSGPEAGIRPEVGTRIRRVFLDLLKFSFPFVGYQSEPVTCLLTVLSGGSRSYDPKECALADLLLTDVLLHEFYFSQALNRYPFEYTAFINFCRLLSTRLDGADIPLSESITKCLLKTPNLTFALPPAFQEYRLVQEEENANTFQLLREVPLFSSSAINRGVQEEELLCIPTGSHGRFVTDSGRVVLVDWEHSGLALMGKRLEAYAARDSYESLLGFLRPDEVAETISLLSTAVEAEAKRAALVGDSDAGLTVLEEASRAVTRTKDAVAIVCDILDNSLQAVTNGGSNTCAGAVGVLTACVQFLRSVLCVCPGRVWAYMGRCELLDTESRAGRLSRLTGGPEMAMDTFELLHCVVHLFAALVNNAVDTSARRRPGVARPPALFRQNADGQWAGMSEKTVSQVAMAVARTTVDIFENLSTCKYPTDVHHGALMRDLVPIMNSLVVHTYGLGDSGERLTECLAPAAGYIVDCFLSSSSVLQFQPILSTFVSALQSLSSSSSFSGIYPQRARILSNRTSAVLQFVTSLVKAAIFLNKPTTALETELFKVSSLLARLCAAGDGAEIRTWTMALLEALILSAGAAAASEPRSLLGCLGPHASRSFLNIISRLDRPFDRSRENTQVWKLLSTIVRSRQRWMANYLLTGCMPRDLFKMACGGEGEAETQPKLSRLSANSVLLAAQNRLRSISAMPSSEALAVLEFLTAAHNHWPWTVVAVAQAGDCTYLEDLRRYVRELKADALAAKMDAEEGARQARMAAYIAETFAMQLYHLRQMGRAVGWAQELLQDLDYFLRDGVKVAGYNTSLHVNFARNFTRRYPGISPEAFKRTLFAPHGLGKQYYYALDVAHRMLEFDPGWIGPRDSGFRSEMETANLNLSLVDGQIALFYAWEFLLLELANCLLPNNNKRIAVMMMQVADQCLAANQATPGPEKIILNLARARGSLALILVQRLADNSELPQPQALSSGDASQLLATIWTALAATEDDNPHDSTTGTATGNGSDSAFTAPDQSGLHRTLLKTLYVVLRGCRCAAPSVSVTQTVLNIIDRVVAHGFRTIVTRIHDQGECCDVDGGGAGAGPEDLSLLTALLQASLAVPGVGECHMQVLNVMATHDVLRVAMSLFSWADRLPDSKGDPVYGELSLLFLLELSAIPTIAEQLALDGLLGHLTSTRLAGSMRRPNVSPFATGVGPQRCYSIWVKAVLPLLINVLGALGATIAAEVVFVLNWFPALLESSVARFEAPGMSRTGSRDTPRHIALLAASEVHSLALLTRVLAALRSQNGRDIPEVSWDAPMLLENVEFWLSRPNLLRESLVPLGIREIEWRATQTTNKANGRTSSPVNKLEQKIVTLLDSVKTILSDDLE